MPYYINKHILFIHIPKCGGTHLGWLLEQNDNQTLCIHGKAYNNIFPEPFSNYSLQHQFYSTIYNYKHLSNIQFNDKLKCISIVRNPYDRLISDLFWITNTSHNCDGQETTYFINKNSTPEQVFQAAKKFCSAPENTYDNHSAPQYKFVTDKNGKIFDNIKIVKLEELYQKKDEINNFLNTNLNIQNKGSKDYTKYFNSDTIKLVNKHYKKDFELFGYDMNCLV